MTGSVRGEKINVLFIVPALGRGGAETQLIDLANGFDSQQFNKTLVVFENNLAQIDRLDRTNIDFHNYSRAYKFDISTIRKIAHLIDKNKIDVIHCTIQVSLLFAWLAMRLAKRKPKLVVAIHTTVNATRKFELFDRLLYRRVIGHCDQVIFVCQAQAKYWIIKYPELAKLAVVVYNGIDFDHFRREQFVDRGRQLRQFLSIPDNAPIATCLAGFRREKGHQYLIEAFATLKEGFYLLLAGDGECRAEIQEVVTTRRLTNRVKFLGEVKDVRPVLAASDVTILASTAVETFSMAMLESMAMEVPVIATDIGGLSEAVIPGETGALVPTKDSAQIAIELDRYLGDRLKTSEMGKKARERSKIIFNKEKMIRDTEAVLAQAVG